jgi:outer membrane protein TolC
MQHVVKSFVVLSSIFISACEPVNFSELGKSQFNKLESQFSKLDGVLNKNNYSDDAALAESKSLDSLVSSAKPNIDVETGFKAAIKSAVLSDPLFVAARNDYLSQKASINAFKTQKDFQVFGTVYGGVEDVTDETVGLALVLNAQKLVFDGGQFDNQLSAQEYAAQAALYKSRAVADERALAAAQAWAELERFRELDFLISSRLEVLDPLISQLERVAEAGVGDVSQVAAAQRTVDLIRVTQTDISERLEQSKVKFVSLFGNLPGGVQYDENAVASAVPGNIEKEDIMQSNGLMAEYHGYQATVASLRSIQAKDSFTVGFESKIQKPLGGSEYASDESIGLVFNKTLYNGNKLNSEIEQAKAQIDFQGENLKATYRKVKGIVDAGTQTIVSMDNAMALAISNAANASEEIDYLRKQLIIGQSTLDSVLNAEARLYEAESKEVNFLWDRRLAELSILAALGHMNDVFEF